MQRRPYVVAGLGVALFAAASLWLARIERAGPAALDVLLEGGIPATVYVPRDGGREAFLDPPPLDARPPGVVVGDER